MVKKMTKMKFSKIKKINQMTRRALLWGQWSNCARVVLGGPSCDFEVVDFLSFFLISEKFRPRFLLKPRGLYIKGSEEFEN